MSKINTCTTWENGDAGILKLLACQPRVTVMYNFGYNLLSKKLTCILLLIQCESTDQLCINPILWIELIHKWSIDLTVPDNFVNKT